MYRPVRVLLIDDNPQDAILLQELLSETSIPTENHHIERRGEGDLRNGKDDRARVLGGPRVPRSEPT